MAQVIENRVQSEHWPDTYVGVITQPWQFSSFNANDPNASKFPNETDPAWASCVAAADAVLETSEPFTTANHYHTIAVSPSWKDETKVVAREGAHVFYCL